MILFNECDTLLISLILFNNVLQNFVQSEKKKFIVQQISERKIAYVREGIMIGSIRNEFSHISMKIGTEKYDNSLIAILINKNLTPTRIKVLNL